MVEKCKVEQLSCRSFNLFSKDGTVEPPTPPCKRLYLALFSGQDDE
jgi:hypothetical protein